MSQLVGSLAGVAIALGGGFIIYGVLNALLGLRLDQEQEYIGADLSIHKIASTSPDDKT
jgi:Amt family ammonium transporter